MNYKPNTYIDDVAFKEAFTAYNEGVKNEYTPQKSFNKLNATVDAIHNVLTAGGTGDIRVATDDEIKELFSPSEQGARG